LEIFQTELTNAFAKNDYVLITGDINIDYLKPLPSNWETILSTYGLDQLVTNCVFHSYPLHNHVQKTSVVNYHTQVTKAQMTRHMPFTVRMRQYMDNTQVAQVHHH
jgi:hypothetical protein